MAVLPGLGPDDLQPLVNKRYDYGSASLSPEDFFVLTRVDGRTSLKQIILISGFQERQALAILLRLRGAGAIYFPGEDPVAPPPPTPAATVPPAEPRRPPTTPPPSPPALPPIDERLLQEEVDLTVDQKRGILTKQASLAAATLYEVLEVASDTDKKVIRRSYFRLSKDYHPDRFYGKKLGSYKGRIDEIFDRMSKAFEILEDDAKREAYFDLLSGGNATPRPAVAAGHTPGPVVKAQAAQLFELAIQHHVTGETAKALQEFAAAIQLDAQPRYLRRAAEASLKAQELRLAEEYAKKAAELDPRNAQSRRILGKAFRAAGRIAEARAELELAVRLEPDNEHIAADLADLIAKG